MYEGIEFNLVLLLDLRNFVDQIIEEKKTEEDINSAFITDNLEVKQEKKKIIRYRKDYMKAYYAKNSNVMKERVRGKYVPKRKLV